MSLAGSARIVSPRWSNLAGFGENHIRMLTCLGLVLAMAGCATAPTNRETALRIDATDVTTFKTSVAALQHRLRPDYQLRFVAALQEIWRATASKAGPDSSEDETTRQYFAQVDGLAYEQIVRLGGPAAELAYQALLVQQLNVPRTRGAGPGFAGWPDSGAGMIGGNNSGVYTGQTPAWSAY